MNIPFSAGVVAIAAGGFLLLAPAKRLSGACPVVSGGQVAQEQKMAGSS